MRWAPWRPVKLAMKLAVCAGTLMAVVYRWYYEPREP